MKFEIDDKITIKKLIAEMNSFSDVVVVDDPQKIEQNKKIVDGVIALWKSSQVLMDNYQDGLDNIDTNGLNKQFLTEQFEKELFIRRHMEDMVKFKTGKDIKDL